LIHGTSQIFRCFRLLAHIFIAQAAINTVAYTVAHAQSLVLASTTSTEQSGLFAHLLPAFKRASGIDVKVVAVGTGQALDMARRGDADVLLVHDPVAEDKLVADGYGIQRHPVMFNDFVLLGPKTDPARAQGKDIALALQNIRSRQASFVSRGDKSGTHAAELRFWSLAGVPEPIGPGYRACGCGTSRYPRLPMCWLTAPVGSALKTGGIWQFWLKAIHAC
jgi:tungstate transport system substrate-binding protein